MNYHMQKQTKKLRSMFMSAHSGEPIRSAH